VNMPAAAFGNASAFCATVPDVGGLCRDFSSVFSSSACTALQAVPSGYVEIFTRNLKTCVIRKRNAEHFCPAFLLYFFVPYENFGLS
jgi:hypothetical protein